MRRRKPQPPTLEEIRAEAERKAQRDREWHDAEIRAARICLEQTFPLLGQDVPSWGDCAESMSLEGTQKRFEAINVLAMYGVSDDALRALVSGSDPCACDRLTAIWWRCLRAGRECTHMWLLGAGADLDAYILGRLLRPVPELVADDIMHHDAQTLLCGTEDQFHHARQRARQEHVEFQARLKALAADKGTDILLPADVPVTSL